MPIIIISDKDYKAYQDFKKGKEMLLFQDNNKEREKINLLALTKQQQN